MNEKWEMCTVSKIWDGSNQKNSKAYKSIYLETGQQFTEYPYDQGDKIIGEMLANGWEPFNVNYDGINSRRTTIYHFRRRVS